MLIRILITIAALLFFSNNPTFAHAFYVQKQTSLRINIGDTVKKRLEETISIYEQRRQTYDTIEYYNDIKDWLVKKITENYSLREEKVKEIALKIIEKFAGIPEEKVDTLKYELQNYLEECGFPWSGEDILNKIKGKKARIREKLGLEDAEDETKLVTIKIMDLKYDGSNNNPLGFKAEYNGLINGFISLTSTGISFEGLTKQELKKISNQYKGRQISAFVLFDKDNNRFEFLPDPATPEQIAAQEKAAEAKRAGEEQKEIVQEQSVITVKIIAIARFGYGPGLPERLRGRISGLRMELRNGARIFIPLSQIPFQIQGPAPQSQEQIRENLTRYIAEIRKNLTEPLSVYIVEKKDDKNYTCSLINTNKKYHDRLSSVTHNRESL